MRREASVLAVMFAATALALPGHVRGGDDAIDVEAHGFVLADLAGRVTPEKPPAGNQSDFLLGEERLRLDIAAWLRSTNAAAKVKLDAAHDAVAGRFDVEVREAYIDWATGSIDVRAGRQVTTWGVGDLLFINDVFPKDWVSFFAGRPMEYLKVGVDGVRLRYTGRHVNGEILALPFFQPDRMPTPDRFSFFDPFSSIPSRAERFPDSTYGNTELAARLYGRLAGIDVAAYAYKGYWRMPGMMPNDLVAPTEVTFFYPRLAVFGVSGQANGFGGVVSAEGGYYKSRDDPRGDDPTVPSSQLRLLAGYQRQIGESLTLGFQYYYQRMIDHDAYVSALPPGFPAEGIYRDTLTLRLDHFFKHQTLKLSTFFFYSPVDRDYLFQPQVSYKLSDELSTTLGANIFGGTEQTTFLGQFDKNDNVYVSLRFDF
ncbi:MAG: hypothetical protein HYX75_16680 [Acidobacteria bacterium]|nr:hypothetical protein [Acidobacteriota bacterium]